MDEERRAFYDHFAGVYLPEGENAETLSRHLLQLYVRPWNRYSWGRDKLLSFWGHGIFDYSAADADFVRETGNGGAWKLRTLSLWVNLA